MYNIKAVKYIQIGTKQDLNLSSSSLSSSLPSLWKQMSKLIATTNRKTTSTIMWWTKHLFKKNSWEQENLTAKFNAAIRKNYSFENAKAYCMT